MAAQQTARLCANFHVPGRYVLIEDIDDDGSTYSFPKWFPGEEHAVGEWFNVHRIGKAHGLHGIGDGIEVALCYRELRPATDDLIGEAEILAIPTALLSFTPPPETYSTRCASCNTVLNHDGPCLCGSLVTTLWRKEKSGWIEVK